MKKFVRISDFCPETEQNQTIEVTFAEVRMVGNPAPGYKATSYFCEYANDHGCNSNGSNGANCPLFKAAAQQMV